MTVHVSAESLSAYLDRELRQPELGELERHLKDCPHCRQHLESLGRVVGHLERLERAVPPPLLGAAVARRVALERRPRGLVEQVESRLRSLPLESHLFTTLAVVLALAIILYLFVDSAQKVQHLSIPVRVATPEASVEVLRQHELRTGTRVELAGGVFRLQGEEWRQQGLEGVEPEVTLDAADARELLDGSPGLAELLAEGRGVVLEHDGRVLRITP